MLMCHTEPDFDVILIPKLPCCVQNYPVTVKLISTCTFMPRLQLCIWCHIDFRVSFAHRFHRSRCPVVRSFSWKAETGALPRAQYWPKWFQTAERHVCMHSLTASYATRAKRIRVSDHTILLDAYPIASYCSLRWPIA